MTDPALDQPQLDEYDDISPEQRFLHANGELRFHAGRNSDLHDLHWHWHERAYARSIRIRIDAPMYTSSGISSEPLDDVLPLAVQQYPGYQETIYGVEGVIVSKRIFAPLGSNYDRSVLWMLEAQAEGDRLIQILVEIDWGQPLDQRMVDGLLVAQKNPGEAKGMHDQHNAESTRVFGAAEGRPDFVQFPSESQAQLVYHVLVAGQVDLPLILAISDVGEQVAWNGFLVQRDIARAFEKSRNSWHDITHRGRLWTPDARTNRAVQTAKIGAVHGLARFRTGYAPADGQTASVPGLVDLLDTFAPERSRALLDTLRRIASRADGALPVHLPTLPRQQIDPPGSALPQTAASYLCALHRQQQRHPTSEWLSDHADPLAACADRLIAHRQAGELSPEAQAYTRAGFIAAAGLAEQLGRSADAARWQGEAEQLAAADVSVPPALLPDVTTVWARLGLSARDGELTVRRGWPESWDWWALLKLPCAAGGEYDEISILWDGQTLHTTRPVDFDGQLALHSQLQAFGSDEHSFDLRFRLDGELFQPEIDSSLHTRS